MGKRYNGAGITQTDYFQVVAPAPLDDRFVVRTQADLFDINTWTINNDVYTYSGLCVSVVLDSDTTKNGIYMLIKSVKYDKQSWDVSAENYDAQGWMKISGQSSGGNNDVLWVTFTKAEHSNGTMTCDTTYANIVSAFTNGSIIVGMYQPAVTDYMKQYFTIPTKVDENTFLFTNQTPNDANEVLFITMTSSAVTLIINKDYAIPDVANNTGRVLTANASNDSVEWRTVEAVLDDVDIIPSMRTINNEPLTNESLGNINVHDGYYFPNAVQDADGNWYGAVVIGDQVWLGENLKTTHYYDSESVDHIGTEITLDTDRFNPNSDSTTVNQYGYLYTGTVVTSNSDLLDSNWRIPSADDWALLDFYLYNQERFRAGNAAQNIAKSLATNEDGIWTTSTVDNSVGKDTDENNTSGFNAFPAGTLLLNIADGFGNNAVFWSSTNMTSSTLFGKTITYNSPEFLSEHSLSTTGFGASLRCVSNLTPEQFRAWYVTKYGTMQHHVNSADENVQADWNQTDTTADDYIKNKPQLVEVLDDLEDVEITPVDLSQQTYFEDAVEDYDGNKYDAVIIGDQVWMAENLRVTHFNDGTQLDLLTEEAYRTAGYQDPGGYSYPNNDLTKVERYGLLYPIYTNQGKISPTGESSEKKISPIDWHIPTKTEWDMLITYCENTYGINMGTYVYSDNNEDWTISSPNYLNTTKLTLVPNGEISLGYDSGNNFPTADSFGERLFLMQQYDENNYIVIGGKSYGNINTTMTRPSDSYRVAIRCVCNLTATEFREQMSMRGKVLVNDGEKWVAGDIADITIQSDWNQTTTTAPDYIKNKPSIPDAQVNADWNATSGAAQILNKPEIPTLRTMNHEQLTNSSLGDINIHDGYYFPNAVQDYDGNWYGAVVIGDQVWLAENLRTTHYADGTAIPLGTATDFITKNYTHVNNDSQNDSSYGLLYNFAATTNGVASDYDALKGTQGVSPTGWHIPSQVEVNNLFSYVSKQKRYLADQTNVNSIAKSLAFDKHWNTSSVDYSIGNNLSLNNNTGFGALPAGAYENNTYSNAFGRIFTIWASSMISTQYGNFYNYFTLHYNSITYGGSGRDTDGLFSVRCISDLSPVQFRNWYVDTYGSMQHHLSAGEGDTQADWNQTDTTADNYIKNKPDITPPVTNGNYVLTCTVNNGVVTYEWVSDSVFIQQ